jgi:thiamine biosynthesis protein ThiI
VDARALVTGESLGQVASQTLANMAVIEEATSLPLLRPLVGMDKAEISAQAEQIGTYEISVQPDQDCCQLFVPRHPAIRMTIDEAHDAERQLDIPAMVSQALEGAGTEEFSFPEIHPRSPASAEGQAPLRIS